MKNIILGILGCMIAVYTIVSCLSIYSISTRKNEMENCISQVLKYHLIAAYFRLLLSQQILIQSHNPNLLLLHS